VLIVEDDLAARRAITRLLGKQGFVVLEAGTVAEALCGLGRDPEWILLDLMLPDGSGIDVLRQVQTDKRSCRVCVVTGCGFDIQHEATALGAEHMFIKPLDIDRLIAVLNQ
jgi:DNA-binding response OmpR family regulator